VGQDAKFDLISGFAETEAVVVVTSALSKNGVFYVMPTPSAGSDMAYLLTKISDRIRCSWPSAVL